MLRPTRLAGALLAAAMILDAEPALAWGNEGHEVIGLIADHYLIPQARAALASLLGPTDPALPADIADRATWADRFRESSPARRAGTHNWHFVDIEIDGSNTMAQACFGHLHAPPPSAYPGDPDDCVVDKIEQFRVELANPATPPAERQYAAQFLLHFVGDVHQPLHAADHNDRGGNALFVTWNSKTVPAPLHSFWDDETVSGNGGADPNKVAINIIHVITPQMCREALTGVDDLAAPEAWGQDSFTIARDYTYHDLPAAPTGHANVKDRSGTVTNVPFYHLDAQYVGQAHDIGATQLAKAGIRLAAILNRALAGAATQCQ